MRGDTTAYLLEVGANAPSTCWDETLRRRGFAVERVDGASAAVQTLAARHDVTLIPRLLSDGADGIELGQALRRLRPELGIVMLGPAWDPCERRRILEGFADECVSESTEIDELAALLVALRRRTRVAGLPSCSLYWRRWRVDFMGGFVEIDGREIALQPLQLRILGCLIQHAGSVVTREQLQRLVFRVSIGSTSIARQICVLRRQLGVHARELETLQGGYGLGLS